MRLASCLASALLLLLVSCGAPDPTGNATPSTAGPVLELTTMRCGNAVAPYSTGELPVPGPLDDEGEEALAILAANDEGTYFTQQYQYGSWEQTESAMILLGTAVNPAGDQVPYSDVTFEKRGESWVLGEFGQCHWVPDLGEEWGFATWRVDDEPGPERTSLTLIANEVNCAGGEAPDGRAVKALVTETAEEISILVAVEPVWAAVDVEEDFAVTCPGNPDFELDVELDTPVGERSLRDASQLG